MHLYVYIYVGIRIYEWAKTKLVPPFPGPKVLLGKFGTQNRGGKLGAK